MIDNLDLKQLGLFLKIVDENGIARAARSLGVSQPYVSQELQRIEAKVGHRLFERDGRSIILTSDGEALAFFARSMLNIAQRTLDYFSRPRSRGPIRVGLTEELARVGLIRVLTLFAESHEGFRLEIETSFDSEALRRGVREARLDVAVGKCFGPCAPGEILWSEPVVWFGREGKDYSGAPLPISVAPEGDMRTVVLDRLRQSDGQWTIAFQSASYSCLEAAVLGGMTVGPGPSSLSKVPGARILEDPRLPELPDATFFVVHRPGAPGAEEFETVLREVLLQIRGRRSGPLP